MARKKIKKPANAYHAHRERQSRRILDAASKLFNDRGIDRVTMADITAGSGVQPSTMYQYFSNKDDIVWALVGELMRKSSERAKQTLKGSPNALARIAALLELLANELANSRDQVRFMAQFDAMYARDWPVERLLTLESQIYEKPFRWFTELIREGIKDGSLRSDLDPDLTMHAVINGVIAAQRRLASLGDKIEQEYGNSIDRLFRETVRVMLLGLRAPETSSDRSQKKRNASKVKSRKRSL